MRSTDEAAFLIRRDSSTGLYSVIVDGVEERTGLTLNEAVQALNSIRQKRVTNVTA